MTGRGLSRHLPLHTRASAVRSGKASTSPVTPATGARARQLAARDGAAASTEDFSKTQRDGRAPARDGRQCGNSALLLPLSAKQALRRSARTS